MTQLYIHSCAEYWGWLPFLSPGDLPDPGIEPVSPAWQVDSLPLSHQGSLSFLITEYMLIVFTLVLQDYSDSAGRDMNMP